jgi:multidrug resistance efflux pump
MNPSELTGGIYTRSALRLLALLLLAGTAVAGCSPDQPPRTVAPGQKHLILNATLAPARTAAITPAVSARIDRILVEVGDEVVAGGVLVELDPTLPKADVQRAAAQVVLAEDQLALARAEATRSQSADENTAGESAVRLRARDEVHQQAAVRLENAKAHLDRLRPLRAARVVSARELDLAENEYADALSVVARLSNESLAAVGPDNLAGPGGVRAAEARLSQAGAELSRAEYNLGQSLVRAPFAGVVTAVRGALGNVAYLHNPLVELCDISEVRVEAELSRGLLPFVAVGQPAEVTVNTTPPTVVAGKVHSLTRIADPKTQYLTLVILLENPDYRFQPGFSARVKLSVDPAVAEAHVRLEP